MAVVMRTKEDIGSPCVSRRSTCRVRQNITIHSMFSDDIHLADDFERRQWSELASFGCGDLCGSTKRSVHYNHAIHCQTLFGLIQQWTTAFLRLL